MIITSNNNRVNNTLGAFKSLEGGKISIKGEESSLGERKIR